MLLNEAIWLGKEITSLKLESGMKFLNFGSQSSAYNKDNYHIIKYLIDPIKEKHTIFNLDLKSGDGVDIVGNIYNDAFYYELKKESFNCILLCNVLEHVVNIEILCTRLNSLLKDGGLIIFSGPKEYPTHYDPIDNGFRPSVNQVKELFPNYSIVRSDIVTDYSFSYYLLKNPKRFIIELVRLFAPFYRYDKWKKIIIPKYKYWNRKYKVTCAILKKNI